MQIQENPYAKDSRSRELSAVSRTETIIRNLDERESENGFQQTFTATENSSRLDSIANFHIITNKPGQAQIFYDTDSDEEQQDSFKMPQKEQDQENDFRNTTIEIENPKSRGVSITNMRALSITRIPQQMKVVLIQKGYMSKRSPSIIQCWQRRFFILTNNRLQYYKNEQEFLNKKPPKGILNFQQVCIETEFKDIQFLIYLKIRGEQRIFQLKCANQPEFDKWKMKLTSVINQSVGKIQQFDVGIYKDDVNPKEKFWRHLRITEKEFEEKADTGDLILCSNVKKDHCVHYEAAFLLFKMEDTYDLQQKGLFVLSPSQNALDIIMGTWDQFKDFHMEHYTDICLRQLKVDRDEDFLQSSDDFMNELRNKPFFGDGKSDVKRSYSQIEIILKYLRCLNTIKQKTKDERKMPISSLGQANSHHLSLSNKDFLGEEQYLMVNKLSSMFQSVNVNDQDKIQSMFDEIEHKKKLNSVSEIEIESFNAIGQENYYQELPDRQTVITKKDKADFIQGVSNQ